MLRKLALIALMSALMVQADSKGEARLRSQLVQAQELLAESIRDRRSIEKALAQAATDRKILAEALMRANAALRSRQSAQQAEQNVVNDATLAGIERAQRVAGDAKIAADLAETRARLAVVDGQSKLDALQRTSQSSNVAIYATLITSVFGLVTMLVGFAWKAYSDDRNHRWAVEDAERRALLATQHHATELSRITEFQESAKAAYREANAVNLKIESLGQRILGGATPPPGGEASETKPVPLQPKG